MSIMAEYVDSVTVPIMTSYNSISRGIFPILVQNIEEDKHYYIPDIEVIKENDPMTYQGFKSRGTKSAFIQAIRSTSDLTLGFMILEFSINVPQDIPKLERALRDRAIKISGALEITQDNTEDIFRGGK